MGQFIGNYYEWIKALHIIAVISWMAGLLYLPRLFIYHNDADPNNKEQIETFKIMERRLLKAIMNPAMLVTWILGLLMLGSGFVDFSSFWIWIKLALVALLTWFHMWLGARRKDFEKDENTRSTLSYRYMNEVPTVIMIVIVIMVVVEPF